MSRIGKKPIEIPKGVSVTVDGNRVTVKGPKGELTRELHPEMIIAQEDGTLSVSRPSEERRHRQLHGLTRSLINNMVEGVSTGYTRRLEIEGTGYSSRMEGNNLRLSLGFSHDILVVPPPTIKIVVEGNRGQIITLSGVDKELLGQIAADIRKLRPPEPYKGKGIRYAGEQVRRKAGKSKVGG